MKRWFALGLFIIVLMVTLTACGSPASAKNVQVTLTDFKITTDLTTFAKDTPYHFTITNKGTQKHEFMILPPMMANMSMDDMHKQALGHIDNINPGETQTLDITFQQTEAAGKLELACHLTGHYEAGMHESITVQ